MEACGLFFSVIPVLNVTKNFTDQITNKEDPKKEKRLKVAEEKRFFFTV